MGKIIIANSVGVDECGNHIVHFPSRWTACVGREKRFTYYPYELAYLSTLLKRDTGHQVRMVDGNLLQLTADQYIDLLKGYRPDWLVMEPSTLSYPYDLKIALGMKNICGTKTIFCGQHPTAFPDEVSRDGIDYVCIGEYEYTVLDIVRGADPQSIRGLYPNKRRPLFDINDLPFPEDEDISRWDYINISGSDYKEIEMFASRGCPMSCVFCVCRHLYYDKPVWRPRLVSSVIDEIKHLRAKYPHMEGIFFDEEYHNVSKKFILDLTRAIRENGLANLKYNAMCGYFTMDREMLEAMKAAGYYKLRIGIETASPAVAKAINKNIDIPKLRSILKTAHDIGLRMYGTFTLGAPGSTRREDLKTIRLLKELLETGLLSDGQISICTPQPGTPYYSWAEERGYLVTKDWRKYDGATSSVVNYGSYSNKEIEEVLHLAFKAYSAAVSNRDFTRDPLSRIKDKIGECGIAGALTRAVKRAASEMRLGYQIRH